MPDDAPLLDACVESPPYAADSEPAPAPVEENVTVQVAVDDVAPARVQLEEVPRIADITTEPDGTVAPLTRVSVTVTVQLIASAYVIAAPGHQTPVVSAWAA